MRAPIVVAATLLALLATGCGAEVPQAEPAEPAGPTPGEPDPTDAAADGESVSGTLEGNADLEGGCAWLVAEDGTQYEVLYPEGYEVRFDPVELVGPDGAVVATEGDEVTVHGRVATDRVSICQVGTIFEAQTVDA